MNTPALYSVEHFRHAKNHDLANSGSGWVLARPLSGDFLALGLRLRLAWGVFTGRYDVLRWESTGGE